MTKEVDRIGVCGDETADGGETFRECAHNKIHIVGESKMVANTPAFFPEYTQSVCFVNHYRAVILSFQGYDFGEFSQIAFHGKDTVNNNKLYGLVRQRLEKIFKVFHVVVLVV